MNSDVTQFQTSKLKLLIPLRIPKDCKDASIMITNTSTSEVMSVIPISCNEDHVSIDAGTLASGMCSYTLYVDER